MDRSGKRTSELGFTLSKSGLKSAAGSFQYFSSTQEEAKSVCARSKSDRLDRDGQDMEDMDMDIC
eukprot:2665650-Ditylum_brightwellii.AAC.1